MWNQNEDGQESERPARNAKRQSSAAAEDFLMAKNQEEQLCKRLIAKDFRLGQEVTDTFYFRMFNGAQIAH